VEIAGAQHEAAACKNITLHSLLIGYLAVAKILIDTIDRIFH